jgi:hypothetical protein
VVSERDPKLERSGQQMEPRSVRLLITFLSIGLVLIVVILTVTRDMLGESLIQPELRWIFRLIAFVVLAGVIAVRGLQQQRAEATGDAQRRLSTALLVAIEAEAVGMIGTIFWFLTGDVLILFGVVAPAILLLWFSRPSDEGRRERR